MPWLRFAAATAALFVLGASADAALRTLRSGDVYELTLDREMSQQGPHGMRGRSSDRDTIVERVLAVRDGGLELEFDLPKDGRTTPTWQYPVRVFRPAQGPMQLLNRAELEARIDPWLKAGGFTRETCGHWIFTWNGFRIECDPGSVIGSLAAWDLDAADLRAGGVYRDDDARDAGVLAWRGGALATELPIDADKVRRQRAEGDVVVAELMRKPMTLEAALARHAADIVSGTLSVTSDLDPAGAVRRRTRVARLEIHSPDGQTEVRTITETLERRLVSRGRSGRTDQR